MLAEMKFTISETDRVIESVIKQTVTQPAQLAKSIEEFQQLFNKAITNIIENSGQSGGDGDCSDIEDVEDDEDDDAEMTPTKKKKNR